MTDAQMLQNLLAVHEGLVAVNDFTNNRWDLLKATISALKEVIAGLRRRIELEESK